MAAVAALAELGEVRRVSRLYRTAPVGGPPGQPAYRNAVVAVEPRPELGDAQAFLAALHRLEARFGRRRRIRWEARRLDLDLLAFGDEVRHQPGLRLPHPRMLERAFVLAPLLDVAPAWRHPADGRAAVDALASLDASGVEVSEESWTPR